jgi:glycosyltransferase involved in cell wall biosynthesis
MTATVIIPTTGAPEVEKAINSVLNQSYLTTCYVVCDGMQHYERIALLAIKNKWMDNPNFKFCNLPINVGANGFYGHRIYAAFAHLVNTDYLLYLDQDNSFDEHHVLSCVHTMLEENTDWCYSLRKICDPTGEFICNDDCESLGKWNTFQGGHHIDTNSYCLSTKIGMADGVRIECSMQISKNTFLSILVPVNIQ